MSVKMENLISKLARFFFYLSEGFPAGGAVVEYPETDLFLFGGNVSPLLLDGVGVLGLGILLRKGKNKGGHFNPF